LNIIFKLPDGQELPVVIENKSPCGSPYKRVYQGTLRQRLQDLVIRSGVTLCGAYPEAYGISPMAEVAILLPDNSFRYTGHGTKHPETNSMHAFGCINLLYLLTDEFPRLFLREGHSVEIGLYDRDLLRARDRLARLFAYHDSSESFSGDVPDDGSCPAKDKKALDLKYFLENVKCLEPEVREQLICDFVNFQYPTATGLYKFQSDYDRKLIQIAKLIDKLDAVLVTLKDELEGHPGFLSEKKKNYGSITKQDQSYIDLCGTSAIADCWAAHFAVDYHEFYGFDVMMNILYVAVMETRGEWYCWWDKLCQMYPTIKFTPPLS